MTSSSVSSYACNLALNYLNKVRELDKWSIESKSVGGGGNVYRLCRRNIPLTDAYFLDIHYDASKTLCVVGILSKSSSSQAQAQVLVDKHGKPSKKKCHLITVFSYPPNVTAKGRSAANNNNNSNNNTRQQQQKQQSSTNQQQDRATISDEDNYKLVQYGCYFAVFSIVFKFVSKLFGSSTLMVLLLPTLYYYAINNCPTNHSFDPKKEIKRVLRGHHLPDNHPEKPKQDFFSQTFARLNATLSTELATTMGYTVKIQNFGGAAVLATVTLPTTKQNFYWVGIFNNWHYIYTTNQ